MVLISERLAQVPKSGIREIFDIAQSMTGVINLGIGETDFGAPAFVAAEAKKAISQGYGKYTPNAGLPELREQISKKLKTENNIVADPESEIVVTSGATQAIFVALNCLLNPGDEVLLPTPLFPAYGSCVKLAGATCVEVPTIEDERFGLDLDALEQKCSRRTKVLVINSPCNPTGSVFARKSIEKACELAAAHDLYVISDEIYEKFLYEDAIQFSPASIPEFRERVITINGFSKTFGMTGWRLGYAAANPEIISAMVRYNMYNAVCANSFTQVAGIAALKHPPSFFKPILSRYKKKQQTVCSYLDGMGWEYQRPHGSFYVFPKLPSRIENNSMAYSKQLLQSRKVATIPGSSFGAAGEHHVRISFSVQDSHLRKGLDRVKKF